MRLSRCHLPRQQHRWSSSLPPCRKSWGPLATNQQVPHQWVRRQGWRRHCKCRRGYTSSCRRQDCRRIISHPLPPPPSSLSRSTHPPPSECCCSRPRRRSGHASSRTCRGCCSSWPAWWQPRTPACGSAWKGERWSDRVWLARASNLGPSDG